MSAQSNAEFIQVLVNGQFEWEIPAHPESPLLDVIEEKPGVYHVMRQGKSYRIEVLEHDLAERQITLLVNGQRFDTRITGALEHLVRKLGLAGSAKTSGGNVKAPMPGMVIKVMVNEGQAVEKGDTLLILEAMKMENAIKAVQGGTVKAVSTSAGQAVEKGALLIELV